MNKKDIIKENYRFQEILNNRKFIYNEAFTIYYIDSDEKKWGIIVSKKFANAVLRNKNKRQIRNILYKYKKLFPNNKEYIIMIKRNFINESFNLKEKKLLSLIKKLELKK